MSQPITLDLSDDILQQAQETAERTGSSLDSVLVGWLKRGAADEDITPLSTEILYEVWSPYDSAKAAAQLRQLLEDDQRQHG